MSEEMKLRSIMQEIKLARMDLVNTMTEITIIKKRLNNIEKIAREILKRVSL